MIRKINKKANDAKKISSKLESILNFFVLYSNNDIFFVLIYCLLCLKSNDNIYHIKDTRFNFKNSNGLSKCAVSISKKSLYAQLYCWVVVAHYRALI